MFKPAIQLITSDRGVTVRTYFADSDRVTDISGLTPQQATDIERLMDALYRSGYRRGVKFSIDAIKGAAIKDGEEL